MRRILISFVLCHFLFSLAEAQDIHSLEGSWELSLGDSTHYDDYVMLPGSLLTNGKGNPVSVGTQWTGSLYDSSYYFNPYMEKYRHEGRMKFPFFLTPERHYVGSAWYRKSVYVPADWKGRTLTLLLERPHIETTVYVNGREAGHQMSLSVPHRYDVTKLIKAGEKNDIAICVYNGIENVCVGQDSHSVTDQTQGNWNGIAGRIELQAQWRKLNVKRVRIIPSDDLQTFTVDVRLENHIPNVRFFPLNDYYVRASVVPLGSDGTPTKGAIRLAIEYIDGKGHVTFKFFTNVEGDKTRHNGFNLWDEFHPNLYRLTVEAGEDVYETVFGLRKIGIDGRQMTINGRPLYLRGTVENCCFPETGYPPTNEDEWMHVFRKCKEYGLNHVRFHSYCPPEAAFSAADRVGIYLQPEGPSWPNHGVKLRRGQAIDQYLLEESRRIIDEYGHHPSFVMMAAGNEPAGDWVSYCNDWVRQMHEYDSTRVYCGASVGGGWAWDDGSEYHVKGGARGLDWDRHAPQSQDDYYDQIEFPRNYKPLSQSGEDGKGLPNQSPIVAHEQGQWCAFPDFKEIPQYTGVYKARNLEIFRDLLTDHGMASLADSFLMASGQLQTLCYKYEIERNLRTPDYTGFQLLGLNDYSGQGSALVGPLNVHWREKGYCTASDWRQFCSPLVPLARFPRFVYTSGDSLVVPVEAYNATYAHLTHIRPTYYVVCCDDSLRVVKGGMLSNPDVVPIGKNIPLGVVRMSLDSLKCPAKYRLVVRLANAIVNSWDFWLYPSATDVVSGSVVETADYAQALKLLKKGATVLLTAAGKVTLGSDVVQHYLPVFWNTSWFKMRPPHTTGAYIHSNHPLFGHGFPTDSWSNLNWWELLNRAQVMNLEELPADYQSPIQPIDTWHVSRKLGMVVEARVGKGRLFMTTMDITSSLDTRPVARQMRCAILDYMQSADFQPALQLQPSTVQNFFTRQAQPVNMFTNDSPDELKPKLK